MDDSNTFEEAIQLDRGPAVLISSWVLITLSAVFVAARGAARKKLLKLESGDILLPLALILALVQTACIQLAVDNGLGRPRGLFGPQALDKYNQLMYWGQLLYILILGITKATIILLIIPLGPPKLLLVACYIVGAQVMTSTLALTFATAFQCDLPKPWEITTHHCINISALNRALAITTVVTDIFTITLPLVAMILLNLRHDSRVLICSLLATRLVVPLFVVVQFAYLLKYDASPDPTFDNALVQIWIQVVLNLSIITACMPSLGCILSDLALGLIGRRMVPHTITWGRYSPSGISRFHVPYMDQDLQPLQTPDRVPLCSGGLSTEDEKTKSVEQEQEKNPFSWVKLNEPSNASVKPEVRSPHQNAKQVRFEDVPPDQAVPLPTSYPESENRSTTLDVLADYTSHLHPGQFENPTMPPPPIPAAKSRSLQRRISNAWAHKRSSSVASSASSAKISEPAFVRASTLVTPPSSNTGNRESFQYHRPTRSTGSVRPTSSIYSNRDSFVRTHRLSKSMSSFPFRRSGASIMWPGWFERWENKIDEESSQLGSGSFVDLDEEFERCRTRHGQNQWLVKEV